MAAGAVRLISNCSGPSNAFPDAKINNSKKAKNDAIRKRQSKVRALRQFGDLGPAESLGEK
jgi:hypothetical protein